MSERVRIVIFGANLDWTIIRSCWLFDSAAVTGYRLTENGAGGMFTARADLAASMLAQLSDDRFMGKAVGVNTTAGTPSIVRQIWHEGIRKKK